MAKFMFLLRGGDCQKERSPEEMQQSMQAWGAWMTEGKESGWLLDPGNGLKAEARIVQADRTVTDGPFAESKELVGGYCLIEAADLSEAVEHAKAMPQHGAVIEVRELQDNSME